MSSVTKQKSHAGRAVFIFFLVFTILVAGVVIGLSYVFKNKDVTPSIAGYSLYIMDSDKMLDKVPRGALVLASNDTPSMEKLGKAVLCEKVPGVGTSVFWLASVDSKGEQGVVYTVYQEKNPALTYELSPDNVVGEATTYYTWAGKVITFMTSRFGMVICIGSPIALMIIIELIMAIASSDNYDDDDDEDDDDSYTVSREKPTSIDDVLFSGDDATPFAKSQLTQEDEEYIGGGSVYGDEETEADIIGGEPVDITPKAEPKAEEEEEPAEEQEQEAEVIEEAKAEEPEPEVHKVKLPPAEKQESENEVKTVKIPAEPKPAPKVIKKPAAAKPRRPKSMDTSIEDLMKLMEEQQQKLRDEINKK